MIEVRVLFVCCCLCFCLFVFAFFCCFFILHAINDDQKHTFLPYPNSGLCRLEDLAMVGQRVVSY
jgi:hypothetical protein